MLQAPKDNDTSAQELAEEVGALVGMLKVAAEQMGTLTTGDAHGGVAAYLMELQTLYE